jgi:DNA polymerase-3 subunit beta
MNVICGKEELLRGIQIVHSTATSRNALPVLSNFLFETQGDKIKLSSTDLEVAVECYIKGEITEDGGITMPTKRLADIVKELPEGTEIGIKSDETNHIDIRCGKSKFNLMGIAKEEYPVIPTFSRENSFTIEKEMFASMLRKTIFSASRDLQRYVLNGVYFVAADNKLSIVATDGKRLAYVTTSNIKEKAEGKAIVSVKTVGEILKLLSLNTTSDSVKINITTKQIAMEIDDIILLSTLIEGIFPNYEQVIPKKPQLKIKLNVKDTLAAVKQMTVLTTDRLSSDKSSAVKFSFNKDILKISASTAGVGSGEVILEIEYNNEPAEINFNPDFIREILQNINEDFVMFEFTNSLNPALISPKIDKNYLCVVMPMRV